MGKVVKGVSRGLFGGSDSKQKSGVDSRFFNLYNENVNYAKDVANNLGARQISGFAPGQQQAFDMLFGTQAQSAQPARRGFFGGKIGARPAVEARAGTPGINDGMGMQSMEAGLRGFGRTAANPYLGGQIAQYMNPFQEQVTDRTIAGLNRGLTMANQQSNAQAVGQGAFGGSRQAVLQAENQRNYGDTLANTLAGLNSQNYNTALGAAQNDAGRQMEAQNALVSGGAALNNTFLGNIQAMLQAGGMQQQLAQQQSDAYRNLPLEQLQVRTGAIGVNPGGGAGMQSSGKSSSDKGLFGSFF